MHENKPIKSHKYAPINMREWDRRSKATLQQMIGYHPQRRYDGKNICELANTEVNLANS